MKILNFTKMPKRTAVKNEEIADNVTGKNKAFLSDKLIDIAKIANNKCVRLSFSKSQNPLKDELIMQVKNQEVRLNTFETGDKHISWVWNKMGEAFIKFTEDSKANLAIIEKGISQIKK